MNLKGYLRDKINYGIDDNSKRDKDKNRELFIGSFINALNVSKY